VRTPAFEGAEVVIVGGGHNGLICAGYLALAGLNVLVLEKNDVCGGALFSTTRSGFTLERGAIDHSTIVGSPVPEELSLYKHGLDYVHRINSAMHLFADGTQVVIGATPEETAESISRFDSDDAEAWLELARLSVVFTKLWTQLTQGRQISMNTATRLGSIALGRHGRRLMALAQLPVDELAARWFRTPHLRALAMFRSQFSGLPPWEPGTGAVFGFTPGGHGRRFSRPVGGSRALVAALESSLAAQGGHIRGNFEVERVERRGNGWLLHDGSGETVHASHAVVSAIPPRDFVLRLLGEGTMRPRLLSRFNQVEVVSGNLSQYTICAALRSPPIMGRIEPGFRGSQLWMLQNPADVTNSSAAAAAGELPERPGVLVTIPSILDPSAAPAGAATAWINGFVAHRLRGPAHWGDLTGVAMDRIWSTIDSCLPGVRDLVVEEIFTSPDDLERWLGAGNPGSHIAPTLSQLTNSRPIRGCADHRSGVGGLYFTGAGTNPGPGISGLPGRACARAMLADLAKSQANTQIPAPSEYRRLRTVFRIVRDFRAVGSAMTYDN